MNGCAYALLRRDEVDHRQGRVVALSLHRGELYEPSDVAENVALVEVPQTTCLGALVPMGDKGDRITDRERLRDLAHQLGRIHRGAPAFRTAEGRAEAGRLFNAILTIVAQVDLDMPVVVQIQPPRPGVREALREEAAE